MEKCPYCAKGKVNITSYNAHLRMLKMALDIISDCIPHPRVQNKVDETIEELECLIKRISDGKSFKEKP